MAESEMIILAPHDSTWVDREIQQVNGRSLQSKTIVAFMPGSFGSTIFYQSRRKSLSGFEAIGEGRIRRPGSFFGLPGMERSVTRPR